MPRSVPESIDGLFLVVEFFVEDSVDDSTVIEDPVELCVEESVDEHYTIGRKKRNFCPLLIDLLTY
jgi:hypothetical protein